MESAFQYLGSGRKDTQESEALSAPAPGRLWRQRWSTPALRHLTSGSLQASAAPFPKRPDFKASSSGAWVPRPALAAYSNPLRPRQYVWNPSGVRTPTPVSLRRLPWDPGRHGVQPAPARSAPASPPAASLSPVRQETPRSPRPRSSSGVPEGPPVSLSLLPASAEMPGLVQSPAGPPWRGPAATLRAPRGFCRVPGPPHLSLFSVTPSYRSLLLISLRTPAPVTLGKSPVSCTAEASLVRQLPRL